MARRPLATYYSPNHHMITGFPLTTNTTVITEQEVKKVAHLARLRITSEEAVKHAKNLSEIFDMIAHISEKDTQGIVPMSSPFAQATLALREDNVTESNQRQLLQHCAPQVESGLYVVPQVIE